MPKPQDVDAYIAAAPAESRPILEELRKIVRSTLPKVEEKISWGVPFYRYHGEIGGYAAYKKHVSVGLGADVLDDADRDALEAKGYKVLKDTFQITFDQKVPTTVIRKMLKAKAKSNEAAT
jgi:uncharacterized protein YdhG (YjbR/CyaY superfamily)